MIVLGWWKHNCSFGLWILNHYQFSSLSLCGPLDYRSSGFLPTTNSWSLLKLLSIESVMPSYHLTLCHPLLLLPSFFPIIRVFSSESALRILWPKYWNFGFSISPSNEYSGWFPLGWTGWISLQFKRLSRVFCNPTVQNHQFFSTQLYLCSNSHIHTWLLEKP